MNYLKKYLKYKNKYLSNKILFKELKGGANITLRMPSGGDVLKGTISDETFVDDFIRILEEYKYRYPFFQVLDGTRSL